MEGRIMNQNIEKGRKEARIGLDSEKDIINLINTDEQFRNTIKQCLVNLGFDLHREISARLDNMKADIYIENDLMIGVSIKSSTGTSFHHLDRRWLEEWKDFLNMPKDIFGILKNAILRIANNPKNCFILPKDKNRIKDFFESHIEKIIDEIFTHSEPNLKIFMINDKVCNKLYIFRIEDTINFLLANIRNNIRFSTKGIIKLGDFITVQRKSGNSSKVKKPKTDWKHPGNQLQFKISPIKLTEYLVKNNVINFQIVEL